MTTSGEARDRLSELAYTALEPGNPLGQLQEALELFEQLAPLEARLRQARKEGLIRAEDFGGQIAEAERAEVIGQNEAEKLRDYHDKVVALIAVDDFATDEFIRKRTAEGAPPVAVQADRANEPASGKKSTAKRKAQSA